MIQFNHLNDWMSNNIYKYILEIPKTGKRKEKRRRSGNKIWEKVWKLFQNQNPGNFIITGKWVRVFSNNFYRVQFNTWICQSEYIGINEM